ncbi:Indoleamine 2,3-dioxygenase 2 [Pteropus alecto]|uniref:Indoleamine 2,3-dioxygenase 2 n=1 Tax=Pteropus alecto TaxID=9402 RepID=L5KAL3_PTEAL|nr:Indoleamine 2,3-dioxygenase 2 [Pteropus alecto]
MSLLNCQFLKSYQEQRPPHLVLSFITMGYVWQEGETQPKEALVQAVNTISQLSQDSLLQALQQLRLSIQDITRTLRQMHGMGLLRVEGSAWGQRAWRLDNIHQMALAY